MEERVFYLDPEAFDEFVAMLDRDSEPCPKLKALFDRRPPWGTERS